MALIIFDWFYFAYEIFEKASFVSVRSNEEVWKKTLLIVTYDEHGGCYDSCTENLQPGSAVSPDPSQPAKPGQYGFTFDRFGVRVPTLLISPYIAAGSIHQAPEGSKYPFDHTSIIKTVKDCFNLDFDQLTDRDGNAPSLAGVLSDEIVNMGPEEVTVPPVQVSDETLSAAAEAPLSEYQLGLYLASSILPKKSDIPASLSPETGIVQDGRELTAGNADEALPFIKEKVAAFLGS